MEHEILLKFFPVEIQRLLAAQDVTDLMINSDGRVFVDRNGRLESHPYIRVDSLGLLMAVQNIARKLGEDIDGTEEPILDSRMPDGSRVAAIASHGQLTVTIRKFNRWFTSAELVGNGAMTPEVEAILIGIMRDSLNVLVSGGTSSGKSTLGKALLDHVPESDRLIVIEKPRELAISQVNAVRWEARKAAGDRAAISIADLVVAALRHRPDRIVIGEVREPQAAYELLHALNSGHSGSLSTIHASSAERALDRLARLSAAAHENQPLPFVRAEVAMSINYVVHMARNHEGKRAIRQLIQVTGYDAERDQFQTVSLFQAP